LALIARASFRLHPVPKAARTLVVETVDAPTAIAALSRSQLQPSSLDLLHPGRVAVLLEGSERAVESQLATAQGLVGGAETGSDTWVESRRRQGDAEGRVRFEPGRLAETLAALPDAVVRPSAGIAYTPDELRPRGSEQQGRDASDAVRRLVERIALEFDPKGVFAS
jgi:FAD/FMN-containing dehydrogenase